MTAPAEPAAPPQAPAPPVRRPPGLAQRAYRWLVSPVLAIAILVVVLLCCLVGVTVVRGERAGQLIFATLWFNSLLVLLAISSASAFFSRFWKRKLTTLSLGMILFHLSFLGVLGGVVANGLYSFHGTLRLTEGETVGVGEPAGYDEYGYGRFFDLSRLRGQITLVRMHANYKVGDENKRAAYELEFREGGRTERRVIYITEYHDHDGVRFFSLKEGYSLLLVMADAAGRELFGAHLPLQSLRQSDGSFLYTSGTSSGAATFPFPQPPEKPRLELGVDYWPGVEERTGKVRITARPHVAAAAGAAVAAAEPQVGLVGVGERFQVGGLVLTPREVRYWVGISVRYDPGLTTILASLCSGLLGMALTFIGRVRQGPRKKQAAQEP